MIDLADVYSISAETLGLEELDYSFSCWQPKRFSHKGASFLVPCGKCPACRKAASREWALRLQSELCDHCQACFLTLTYSDECLPSDGSVSVRDLQLFNKKIRQAYGSFRFFAAGEYGELNNRPHYHEILFGLPACLDYSKYWTFGFVMAEDVINARIAYLAGYVEKKFTDGRGPEYYKDKGLVLPFHRMSLRPGIGNDYYARHADTLNARGYDVLFGKKVPLPRFFVRKFGSDDLKYRRVRAFLDRNFQMNVLDTHLSVEKGVFLKDVFSVQRLQKEANFEFFNKRRKPRDPGLL